MRFRATVILVLGLAALAATLTIDAPAFAQESGPVVAGAWTFTVTITSSNLPEDFDLKSGQRTYWFGAGCVLGEPCDIVRTNAQGDRIEQTLTSEAGGWAWVTNDPVQCTDPQTGEVTTEHGADYRISFAFRPTATVERGGIEYVSEMSGVAGASLIVNAAGRADNCTIPPDDVTEARATGTISAMPVPLSSLAPEADPTRLASAPPPAAAAPATIPGFTLPMTAEEARSRLAVARGDRSTVPAALITPGDAVNDAHRLLQNLGLAALLGLLMVFPAQLFNHTYEQNHARIDTVLARLPWRRRGPAPSSTEGRGGPEASDGASGDGTAVSSSSETAEAAAVDATGAHRWRRGLIFALVALLGAVIGGFLDPGFGGNRPSIALLIGVFISILAGVVVAALAARTYRRARHRPSSWALEAIPSALLIAVACVVLSRVVRFEPGYLYGLIGGAAFLVALDRREEGRAETVVMTATLVLAFAAWFVFGALVPQANERDPAFGVLVADSLLAGLFIAGLEGLFFSLIPLRFLPGYRVKAWSWWAWIVLTAVVSFAFVTVLLRPSSGYLGRSTQASVTLTFILFGVFGAASVLFWLYFRLRPGPREVVEPPELELQEAGR